MVFWKKKNKKNIEDPISSEDIRPDAKDNDFTTEKIEEELSSEVLDKEDLSEKEILSSPEGSESVSEEIPAVEKNDIAQEEQEDKSKDSWIKRLSKGLSKSSSKIGQGLADLVTKKKLDQEMIDGLEELLISADLGPKTAMQVVENFSKDRFGKDISEEEIKSYLAESVADILEPVTKELEFSSNSDGPYVVLVCGVNGVGKTTTIGKIANNLKKDLGKKVMLAAGDTFRAAAIEQLDIWAQRTESDIIKKELGSDAASVAYEAYQSAKEKGIDVLLIDTAGRLHNKANLMAELEKIVRVLKKQNENIPHSVLLVLDATTGQNAHDQLRTFKEMVDVSGLIVTKLDGSAKGGVVVGLADQFNIPIHFIGVGETAQDLQPFDHKDFARSLIGV